MADSYKLERGEDLLDVISREDTDTKCNNNTDENKSTNLLQLAKSITNTNLPIASHDFLRDPSGEAIFNYGNLAFLTGFGYPWDEFVQLPSKSCVETEGEVEERQQLLDKVKANAILKSDDNGSSDGDNGNDDDDDDDLASNYDNLIRVRKDGRRILLKGVNLWNVYDVCLDDEVDLVRDRIETSEIQAIGQAVWIRHVEYLDD